MAPGKSNVLAFHRPGWSATADIATRGARGAIRAEARSRLALVESLSRFDAAAKAAGVSADPAELRSELGCYRDLFERAPVGLLAMDLSGRIAFANRAATTILGPGRQSLTGSHLRELCTGEDARQVAEHLARLSRGAAFDLCEITTTRAGEPPLSLRLETLNLGDSQSPGPLRTVLMDTAGLDELEEGLSLAASVVEYTSQAVVVTDAEYRAIAVNPAFTTITGYAATEVLGQVPSIFLHARAIGDRDRSLLSQLQNQGYWQGEFANRRRDGEAYLEWAQINAIPDAQGKTKYYVCMLSDVSGQDASRHALVQLAYRDDLTGLANRASLMEQLERALIAARRDKHPLGLIYIDLDSFKEVNDTLGHATGDRLLQFVAERLRAAVRQTDLVVRIGGDEFAIVMPHLTTEGAASRVAANILEQLQTTPFHEQGYSHRVTASIGITLFPKDGTTVETLLQCADSAMYEAKKAGGSRFQFYSPLTSPDFKQHGGLEMELRQALFQRRLQVRYQPRIRIKDLQIVGCEASVRWDRAEHGELNPAALAALAETTGLAVPLEHWLMRSITAAAPELSPGPPGRLRISVGVALPHFDPPNLRHLFRRVTNALATGGFTFEVELPALLAASRRGSTMEAVGRLRDLGAELTLRGYGSEALSATRLARLPITRVKIPPTLLAGLNRDPAEGAALKGLIALAQALDLKVIADGVETPEQLRFLAEHGCDEAQGELFGAPVSATTFATLSQQLAAAGGVVGALAPAPDAHPAAQLSGTAWRAFARLGKSLGVGA